MQLTQMLELHHLQKLQDSFAASTGLFAVLTDPGGYILTRPSQVNSYSRLILDSQGGRQLFVSTARTLCLKNKSERDTQITVSKISGLTLAAVPLFYEEEHLASWIVGLVRFDQIQPDPRQLQRLVKHTESTLQEVVAAFSGLPLTDREEFRRALVMLQDMTDTVTALAGANYTMVRNNQNLVELSERLDSTAQMLTKFTNSADVGMYVTDFFTGELLQANDYYVRYTGRPLEELLGQPCWKGINPQWDGFCPDCPHHQLLDERGHPGSPVVWERYVPVQDLWFQFTNQAIYWVDGRLAHMVTFTDITQNKQMQNQLTRLAYYDQVLQLPNGLKLEQDLEYLRLQREDYAHLVCFDVVSLRSINDAYSRQTGDLLLQEISTWIQDRWGADTTLYRVEGDGFCLMPHKGSREECVAMAGEILRRFESAWYFKALSEDIHVFCNVSVGVIYMDRNYAQGDEILNLMERTLGRARKDGKIAVYDEQMDQEYKDHLMLELSLKNSVQDGMKGFRVYYQPIIDPTTGMWCALEALCRWESPECGVIAPLVFIHEAEQLGLIGTIGRWVLEQALTQCKEWGLDKLDKFILDVNLSPAQMTDETLVSWVLEMLEKYDYPGNKLSLEITESTEMNFSPHTLSAIQRLREAEVQVALDDFGTGYSSLNNLKNLPVNFIKTDKEFLDNIENDSYLQNLFYVITELAHAADMKIIAEGVETREQMKIMLKNGVDYLQGFLFCTPLSPEELAPRLGSFTEISREFFPIHKDKIDTHTLLETGDITITPALSRTLLQCMQILLSPMDASEAMDRVLKIVGEKFGVGRSYIFRHIREGYYTNTNEWCAPGVQPQKDLLKNAHIPSMSRSWIPMLQRDNIILSSNIQTLPPDIRWVMEEQGIKALAVIPIWQGSQLEGFVGFDDCENRREWQPEEVLLLHNLCLVVANALEGNSLKEQLAHSNQLLESVLDTLELSIYVSDVETGEILFANQMVKETFGQVEGKKCWKALQFLDQRCPFCKVEQLKKNPGSPVHWENYNQVTRRHYSVCDVLVDWVDKKQAHMEYAIDITDIKEYQRQLEEYASLDVFTGILNRNALLDALQGLLLQSRKQQEPVTICFVDIDRLKHANDTYGHTCGDELILGVVEGLRRAISERDVIGRYGGDEFVCTLRGLGMEEARERMGQVQEELLLRSREARVPYSFSYGLVERTELPFETGSIYLERLLDIADKRMFACKSQKSKPLETV